MTAPDVKPYRRDDTGARLCGCDSGPCERLADNDGWCSECRGFCRLREASE